MGPELVVKILALLRLLAFMVFVYLLFGLLVERYSRKPGSQLKAFARIICSPVTRPVARFLAPGTPHRSVLLNSVGVVVVLWMIIVVLQRALTPA
jgi:uncharacterized protein YggT (Ycf19 family)